MFTFYSGELQIERFKTRRSSAVMEIHGISVQENRVMCISTFCGQNRLNVTGGNRPAHVYTITQLRCENHSSLNYVRPSVRWHEVNR